MTSSGMTYLEQVLSNLGDLLDSGPLVNNRVNLVCAYSEVESLCSNVLVVNGQGLPAAIDRVASACGCLAGVTALRCAAQRALASHGDSVASEKLALAIEDAAQFIQRLGQASCSVSCACGAAIEYRVGDVLEITPPARFGVTCRSCRRQTSWFVPSQRPRC